jgi:membrane-bound metal-dependent hydrolase YbcI (DUF457 family)
MKRLVSSRQNGKTANNHEKNLLIKNTFHFQPGGTLRFLQKSFFSPAELSAFFKNHFSVRRNSPLSLKIIFQPGGTLRFLQKSFFSPAELSAFFKNHFSSRRNSPLSSKIIFQPGGTLRFLQKPFFVPAELSAASKNSLRPARQGKSLAFNTTKSGDFAEQRNKEGGLCDHYATKGAGEDKELTE